MAKSRKERPELVSVHELCNSLGLVPRDYSKDPAPRKRRAGPPRYRGLIVAKRGGLLEDERARQRERERRSSETAFRSARQQAEARERAEVEERATRVARLTEEYREWCDALGTEPLDAGEGRWCQYDGQLCVRTNHDHDHPWATVHRVSTGQRCPVLLSDAPVLDMGRWKLWGCVGYTREMARGSEAEANKGQPVQAGGAKREESGSGAGGVPKRVPPRRAAG